MTGPHDSEVRLTAGQGETVLAPPPVEAARRLAAALASPEPKSALAEVVAVHPTYLEGWWRLAAATTDSVEAYAYYRVGYHRGLDALRAAGWRGSGRVSWRHLENRGFLRCLDGLRRSAEAIAEHEEAERCRLFLAQLDPDQPVAPPG